MTSAVYAAQAVPASATSCEKLVTAADDDYAPTDFNALDELSHWAERKHAPDRIVASHRTDNTIDRTRPLCPYPRVATYKGSGSTDDAANFVCAAPK